MPRVKTPLRHFGLDATPLVPIVVEHLQRTHKSALLLPDELLAIVRAAANPNLLRRAGIRQRFAETFARYPDAAAEGFRFTRDALRRKDIAATLFFRTERTVQWKRKRRSTADLTDGEIAQILSERHGFDVSTESVKHARQCAVTADDHLDVLRHPAVQNYLANGPAQSLADFLRHGPRKIERTLRRLRAKGNS